MDRPFSDGYNKNDYNYNDYNYTYDNKAISDNFEYFLMFILICVGCQNFGVASLGLSCFNLLKNCSTNCIKSFRIKKKVTIKKVDSDDEDNLLNECSICLENYKKDDMIIILSCHHNFHEECLKGWFKDNNSCPHCRENII